MAWSYPMKQVQQIPWRSLIRPMLLASIGLHALVLLFPFPQPQAEAPEKPEEETVKLTQVQPQNRPTPKAAPSPTARAVRRPTLTRPIAALPRPASIAPVPFQSSAPIAPAPIAPAPVAPAPATTDAFAANFPRYPGAQPGSFGLPPTYDPFSQKTTDALGAVDGWFRQQLQSKGFTVQPMEQVSQAGRSSYAVSKDVQTKYLTLIPNGSGAGTSILVSDQPLPADLSSQRVISPEEQQFYADLSSVLPETDPNGAWHDIDDPRVLAQPAAFYEGTVSQEEFLTGSIAQLRAGIERGFLGVGQTDAAVSADFSNRLQIAEYQVTPKGSYGGGTLYQISRDGVNGFISIVPTADGSAIAVFIWNRSPS